MKRCLIFDLDGTLVDSLPGIAAALNRSLKMHGLPAHSNAAVGSFVGDGVRVLVQRATPKGSDPAIIDSIVSLFKKDYHLTWAGGTKPYPGILNMLDELQRAGHPLAVLSNKTHEFTVMMVAELFPGIHFASVLGQREGIPHKPHPAGVFQIADIAGTKPEDCVMIGDSSIDMQTAANAEMRAVAVLWGYHDRAKLTSAGADCFIDEPAEIFAALETLSI